jgi:hypothetical protein
MHLRTHMNICIHIHITTASYKHVYTHAHTHTHTYTYTYTYTCTYTYPTYIYYCGTPSGVWQCIYNVYRMIPSRYISISTGTLHIHIPFTYIAVCSHNPVCLSKREADRVEYLIKSCVTHSDVKIEVDSVIRLMFVSTERISRGSDGMSI